MNIFLVRHSVALDRVDWRGDDLSRPLSLKGVELANHTFKALSKIFEPPECLYTSEALRATDTATIFHHVFKSPKPISTSLLNPGFDLVCFKKLLSQSYGYKAIALFGHEPDFSSVIASIFGLDRVFLELKKCSVVVIGRESSGFFVLKHLIQPKLLS